jgi:hypothetical protein
MLVEINNIPVIGIPDDDTFYCKSNNVELKLITGPLGFLVDRAAN